MSKSHNRELFQAVFKRYELKYLLTAAQKETILGTMAPHMRLDQYGRTMIRNLYYDTPTYLLVRRSIERPVYKEKLRIRSYSRTAPGMPVFVELKKKYDGVVYKRRLALEEFEALQWLSGLSQPQIPGQIAKEIGYFLEYYGKLQPVVFLSYEREAYYATDGTDFRVTFDESILCRQKDLSLSSEVYGDPILPEGMTLMEIKCSGGIPMWMTEILSREKIYKTQFSKYGTAYKNLIFPQTHKINGYHTLEVTTNA